MRPRRATKVTRNRSLSKLKLGTYAPRYFRKGAGDVWEDNSLSDWDPNDFR